MGTRRDFCKKTLLATGACSLGGAFLLDSCGTATKAVATDYSVSENKLNIDLSAFADKKYLVFDDNKLELPIYVAKLKDGTYKAFLMRCTHRGCTVQAQGSIMVCPCHGAEFNNQGQVLTGPATQALAEFKTTKTKTQLIVDLK